MYLEEIFELEKKNDGGYYAFFYATCIASGYQKILPRVEEFVSRIGRILYIAPIFRAMIETDWAKPHARRILDEVSEHHHKITIHVIDKLLTGAGL